MLHYDDISVINTYLKHLSFCLTNNSSVLFLITLIYQTLKLYIFQRTQKQINTEKVLLSVKPKFDMSTDSMIVHTNTGVYHTGYLTSLNKSCLQYHVNTHCIDIGGFSSWAGRSAKKHEIYAVADLRGGARDARPPGPKFLHFHAVFGKNWPNNRLAPPLGVSAPSSGKSWIRHCYANTFRSHLFSD